MEKREKLVLFCSISLIAMSAGAYVLLPRLMESFKPRNPNFIGLATHAFGDVKVKYGDSINWRKINKKAKIYSHAYLFTGPNSTSSFAFLDKSTVKLDPNSLVLLNFDVGKDGTVAVNLDGLPDLKIGVLEGKIAVRLLKNSQVRKIDLEQSTIRVGTDPSMLMVETGEGEGDKVALLDGAATVSSKGEKHEIEAGDKLDLNDGDVVKDEVSPELLAEMMKMAQENDRRIFEEEKKKREFLYMVKHWYNYMTGEIEIDD